MYRRLPGGIESLPPALVRLERLLPTLPYVPPPSRRHWESAVCISPIGTIVADAAVAGCRGTNGHQIWCQGSRWDIAWNNPENHLAPAIALNRQHSIRILVLVGR